MNRMKVMAIAGLIFGFCAVSQAQVRMSVKIVNRQDGEQAYSYSVAGRTESRTHTDVNCRDGHRSADCRETTRTTTEYIAPKEGEYSVTGSTLTLELKDGRRAIVNCASKFTLFGPANQTRRSCRIPPMDSIEAEFKGKDAKLFWSVSIDGQSFESETYKVVAVLEAGK